MNPHFHLLTEGLELIAFFFIAPALATVFAYSAWRERANPKKYERLSLASGAAALILFAVARWIHADFRTPQYFLQLTCTLLSFLLWGVCTGSFFSVLLRVWHWHKSSRAGLAPRANHPARYRH
jgi:hypothetical protein